MSNLEKSSDIDSEVAENGGAVTAAGGEPVSSDLNEIVLENAENSVDKTGLYSLNSVDLEAGALETEGICRICHLSMDSSNQEYGIPIELGCCCKDDLAAAHKQCAEAWFKIKGNQTCEICGSVAQNVGRVNVTEATDHWNEMNEAAVRGMASAPPFVAPNFWQGHRFLNFLLALMVFAFVISWLFHFNVTS